MGDDDRRNPLTHATHPDDCRCLMCVVWGKDPRRPGVYPRRAPSPQPGPEPEPPANDGGDEHG